MSKNYKRTHRVTNKKEIAESLDSLIKDKEGITKQQAFRIFIGIIFLVLTSLYIIALIIGIYFNSERCSKLADKYINLKIFN